MPRSGAKWMRDCQASAFPSGRLARTGIAGITCLAVRHRTTSCPGATYGGVGYIGLLGASVTYRLLRPSTSAFGDVFVVSEKLCLGTFGCLPGADTTSVLPSDSENLTPILWRRRDKQFSSKRRKDLAEITEGFESIIVELPCWARAREG